MSKLSVCCIGLAMMCSLSPPAFGRANEPLSLKIAKQDKPLSQSRYSVGDLLIEMPGDSSVFATSSRPDMGMEYSVKTPEKFVNSEAPELPQMQCFVSFGDSWSESMSPKYGIYDVKPDGFVMVSPNENMHTSYGSVYGNGKYFVAVPELYASWVIGMTYRVYDGLTWEEIETNPYGNLDFKARCMACDPVTHRYYGLFEDPVYEKSYYLAQYDMDADRIIKIKDYGRGDDWAAISFTSQGQMYAINKKGDLLKVDKYTGNHTRVGNTGLQSKYMTAGHIDPATNIFWYALCSDERHAMYAVDLNSAKATVAFDMPDSEQILSLFIPAQAVSDGAPACVEELNAQFEGSSLSGEVSFTAPGTTKDGNAGSGTLDYVLYVNGDEVGKNTVAYGARVKEAVTLDHSGEYTFSVVTSNGSGKGEERFVTTWVGYGIPDAPKDVKLESESGKFHLTWSAVETGTENAFIDPAEVRYTVTRYPDNMVVAENISVTEFEEVAHSPLQLTRYYYGVVAHSGDMNSLSGNSNKLNLGTIFPPFTEDFEEEDAVELWTMLNENNDRSVWKRYVWNGQASLQYPYSYSADADDWAVLWPVYMEADKFYNISFDTKASDSYTEKMDVFIGRAPTAQALSEGKKLFDVEVNSFDDTNYSTSFIPETTGLYYLGFHAKSPKGQNNLYIDNVRITSPISAGAPAAAENFAVVRDYDGKLQATLVFDTPSKDMLGRDLTHIDAVKVIVNGQHTGTIENPAPGTRIRHIDTSASNGVNTYSIVCVNSVGEGPAVEMSEFIGFTEPYATEEMFLSRGGDMGEIVVEWLPVEYDVNATKLTSESVSYDLYRVADNQQQLVAEGLKDCKYTDRVCDAQSPQKFVNYAVVAKTVGGSSEVTLSELVAAGAPQTVPFTESFSNRILSNLWATESDELGFTTWDTFFPHELEIEAQDGDNGVAAASAPYASNNNNALLFTGNIDLSGLEKPVLTFYYIDYPTSNKLEVMVRDDKKWNTVSTVTLSSNGLFDWKKVAIPLTDYKDQVIALGLKAVCDGSMYFIVDNIRIAETYTYNLTAKSVTAPAYAKMNEEFTVNVQVENNGLNDINEYTVDLYCDSRKVASKVCGKLVADANVKIEMPVVLPVTAADEVSFVAVVNSVDDVYEADNKIDGAKVSVRRPGFPPPSDLTFTRNEDSVDLYWTAADPEQLIGEAVTEQVDAYPSFSIGLSSSEVTGDSLGEWTVYDMDGLPTYSTGVLKPFPNQSKPMSFIVFDCEEVQGAPVFSPYSGKKAFVCIAARPEPGSLKGNDDWLVSPRLLGCAQTISFFARSYESDGFDTFEIYASSTGNKVDDFTLVAPETTATGEFKLYEYALPEGTVYFAIRCTSYDHYAFIVDDITYVPDNATLHDLTFKGYNVYRNGDLFVEEPVEATEWKDVSIEGGRDYTYHVSAVYDKGESGASNPVSVSIPTSLTAAGSSDILISATPGFILINGAEGESVSICTVEGTLLVVADGKDSMKVPAVPGVYVVKAGRTIQKVLVR